MLKLGRLLGFLDGENSSQSLRASLQSFFLVYPEFSVEESKVFSHECTAESEVRWRYALACMRVLAIM